MWSRISSTWFCVARFMRMVCTHAEIRISLKCWNAEMRTKRADGVDDVVYYSLRWNLCSVDYNAVCHKRIYDL